MHPELLQLQTENRRLGAMVTALAEKIVSLETQLKAAEAMSDAAASAQPAELGPADPHGHISTAGSNQRIRAVPSSAEERTEPKSMDLLQPIERTMQKIVAPSTHPNGSMQNGITLSSPLPATYQEQIARLEREGDCQRRVLLLAQVGLPSTRALALQLQEAISPRPFWPRAWHLAMLLRWLCRPEPPLAPYPVLQSALELSYGGVSKLRRAALTQGLIRKTGQFRYVLTEKAIGLMETSPTPPPAPPREGGVTLLG